MAQTPPAPHVRQHAVRTSAVKIKAAAEQILIDLAHGRLVRSSGRDIAVEVIALCEAIALQGEADKAAARQSGAAA